MIKKAELPFDIKSFCYIDSYEGNYCLFFKQIPMIVVNYQFWTEDIQVRCDYIDYGENEKGYTILIDVPSYENGKLLNVDHVYYGLFKSLKEFNEWFEEPYFLY
jgi:hypothetical protein